jgi:hypothetical protein
MNQEDKTLTLLQVVVPSDTPLTIAAMIKILEILGIVSSPDLVSAMQLAVTLIPTSAQATLLGFVKVLSNLVKHHPKATKAHHDALAELLKTLSGAQDAPLTFGTFLTLCEALLKAPAHKPAKAA